MGHRRESGQTLLMFVFFMIVLILFVGLGIDIGFAYITKAELSKGVDAAALAGMLNFSQGTLTAKNVASATFVANYVPSGRDFGTVTPTISFSTDPVNSNNYINVSATAVINTFFIRVLPQFRTLTVGASAQATESRVNIELVLDRSGSMNPTTGTTKGGGFLPGAVTTFVSFFDEAVDQIGMDSFASTVTNNIPIGSPFKTAISTAASNLVYAGGTFSPGGLTNALVQLNAVPVPTGQNVINVVVFFTDGLANMIQQTLGCGQIFNFGGYDQSGSGAAFFATNAPVTESGQEDVHCSAPDNGQMSGGSCNGCSANSYDSPLKGPGTSFTTDGITADSESDCEYIANQMRAQGMYVFCAGLGNAPSQPVNLTFLQQVANDPNSPTFNPNQPVGMALIANDPSELDSVFKQIAEQILLRLTQ